MAKDSMMLVRNPVYNGAGGVDCEVNHPAFGWIPYSAYQTDGDGAIYAKAITLNPAPYIAPPAQDVLALERSRMIVSRFQARAALHMAGMLVTVETFIKAADFITQLAWSDAQEFRRNSPTIAALAGGLGLDDAELDDLFRTAKNIEA